MASSLAPPVAGSLSVHSPPVPQSMPPPRSLTEGSISRGLFRFALPILFANVLQSLNGSVNSIWVGRFLGEAALTATSNAHIVMFLLIGAAFGVALAATILLRQYIGAEHLHEAK